MPQGIRPTLNKVREALFDILRDAIKERSFLDLYCGAGAVGIEALSNGAGFVSFVDSSSRCISILKKNLNSLKIDMKSPYINIYNMDGIKALDMFNSLKTPFDIIFLDPPYNRGIAKNTLIKISSCDILTPNAIVIAEIYKKEALPDLIGPLVKARTYKYGDTVLEFYNNK